MNEIVLRPAELGDLDVLLEFEQAIIETERPFDPTIREGDDVHYYDLKALIESPSAEVVVALVGSVVVASGYAWINGSDSYLKYDRYSYLGFMYVVPSYRGKGVNKKIVDALEAWSASRGVTEIRLEVYLGNAGAIRAYEKSGYSRLQLLMRKELNT
jgi:GNAT superfamily N-acetyltransferase